MKLKYLGLGLGVAAATVAAPWLLYVGANLIGPLVILVWLGGSLCLLIKPPATKSRRHGDGRGYGVGHKGWTINSPSDAAYDHARIMESID